MRAGRRKLRVRGCGVAGLAAAVLALIAPVGCGYTIGTRGGEGERITLHTVENMLAPPRPGLEYELTKRLRSELHADGRFEVSDGAPIRVRVELSGFQEPTLVRDLSNVQTEIALIATAVVRIEEPGQVRVANVTGRASYAPGIGEGRDAGLSRLWRNLARNILDAVADRDWAAAEAATSSPAKS